MSPAFGSIRVRFEVVRFFDDDFLLPEALDFLLELFAADFFAADFFVVDDLADDFLLLDFFEGIVNLLLARGAKKEPGELGGDMERRRPAGGWAASSPPRTDQLRQCFCVTTIIPTSG